MMGREAYHLGEQSDNEWIIMVHGQRLRFVSLPRSALLFPNDRHEAPVVPIRQNAGKRRRLSADQDVSLSSPEVIRAYRRLASAASTANSCFPPLMKAAAVFASTTAHATLLMGTDRRPFRARSRDQ
jgi:hypothetical protein